MELLTEEERRIVRKIMAHVEKNCTEVAEVEEYLWQLHDYGTEFE